jgi:hypothetical protein
MGGRAWNIGRMIGPGTAALVLVAGTLCGCAGQTSSPAAAEQKSDHAMDSPDWWRVETAPLHGTQIPSQDSFAVIVPRSDIDLESEMGQIPTSAGIESRFYFFRCPCGKVKVLGDFLARDYEADEVIDALRAGKFTVVSMSPILQNTRPIMISIRFQAEGEGDDLVQTLRHALDVCARHSTSEPDE